MVRPKNNPKKKTPSDIFYPFHNNFVPKKRKSNKRYSLRTGEQFNVLLYKESDKEFYVGKLLLGQIIQNTTQSVPKSFQKVKFTLVKSYPTEPEGESSNSNNLVLLEIDGLELEVNSILEREIIKDILSTKTFTANLLFDEDSEVYLELFLPLPLDKFNVGRIGKCIKSVLQLLSLDTTIESSLSNVEREESASCNNRQISQLYDSLYAMRSTLTAVNGDSNVQHRNLRPQLRPYQADAVRWMIRRENDEIDQDVNNPLFQPIQLPHRTIFFDKFTGNVALDMPKCERPSRGGILADEMGLGKTVEVLALILNHRNTSLDKTIRKRKLSYSDDDSDDEPLINQAKSSNTTPSVVCMKKMRFSVEKSDENVLYVNEPETSERRKGEGRTSTNKAALQSWYQSILDEQSPLNKKQRQRGNLECICGVSRTENSDKFATVECVQCRKVQHERCMGFNRHLAAEHSYKCPQCWAASEELVESGATLIVTPTSLRQQWLDEICRHVKVGQRQFRILKYDGSFNVPVIYPVALADYDIVVTTYAVLQHEFRLTEVGENKSLRNKKKYSPPGTPLTSVNWWRLCLDEAQTVEVPTKMVSTMAQRLNARYRWAVTGTPISKDISDLFGLIDYLKITPYCDELVWRHLLLDSYLSGNKTPMLTALSRFLWRTSKKDVLHQINIPPQTIEQHFLEFSAVEKYFYKREHQMCCDDFLQGIRRFNADLCNLTLGNLSKQALKRVMAPLLVLRQVCSHPSTKRGRYLATKRKVSSMKDLLNALIERNIFQAEEQLRLIVSSHNGLAGIFLLYKMPADAVEHYREVLQLYSKYNNAAKSSGDDVLVDKLQVIHAMYNLAQVLSSHQQQEEGVVYIAPTLRDSRLSDDCRELEERYMEKFMTQSSSAYGEYVQFAEKVAKLQESFELGVGQWLSDALDWVVMNRTFYRDLVARIETAADTASIKNYFSIKNSKLLLMHIYSWDADLSNYRTDLLESITKLYSFKSDSKHSICVNESVVEAAKECHLRPEKIVKGNQKKTKAKCAVCQSNEALKLYESRLFGMTNVTSTSTDDQKLVGSWSPTIEDVVLKALVALLKAKNGPETFVQDGETHLKLLDALKKEFKELRRFWTFLDQQVCAQDELDMCKMRMQLRQSTPQDALGSKNPTHKELKNLRYESVNKLEGIHLISVHELDFQKNMLEMELIANRNRLSKSLGTLKYLRTLRQQQYEGVHPDPCPICKNPLQKHWSILQCGHCFCLDCLQSLFDRNGTSMTTTIQCPICRTRQNIADISYIKFNKATTEESANDDNAEEQEAELKGEFSTKIEAVVRLIMKLKRREAAVKVLVFSHWIDALISLQKALEMNQITALLSDSASLEKKIDKFKHSDCTALLLPINLGSKGLNLIEATHVVMVEPVLSPADELQAIGRVHRIGQTKETIVHKFIIRNTIEESIHNATSANADLWEKKNIKLKQLAELFNDVNNDIVEEEQREEERDVQQ